MLRRSVTHLKAAAVTFSAEQRSVREKRGDPRGAVPVRGGLTCARSLRVEVHGGGARRGSSDGGGCGRRRGAGRGGRGGRGGRRSGRGRHAAAGGGREPRGVRCCPPAACCRLRVCVCVRVRVRVCATVAHPLAARCWRERKLQPAGREGGREGEREEWGRRAGGCGVGGLRFWGPTRGAAGIRAGWERTRADGARTP